MRYILDIDVAETESKFALQFFNAISFVKKVRVVENNEITNPAILKSIDDYEKGLVKPTPLNLAELKAMIDA